ncbi:MAG: hypothetical protein PHC34_09935 [Candidatus Gastranaerophilales bacterium]|nr:hypothetical protein [Candidatus Gastranaerophilales bacterium]
MTEPRKYSPERYKQPDRRIDSKYEPYILDSNPFPSHVGIGNPGFEVGRVIPGQISDNIPFSEQLREKQIISLNDKLEDFTFTREPNIIWVCGQRGVGKTSLLQYYFQKPLIRTELLKRSSYWYITYDKHEDTKFLVNPFKYLLEQLHTSLRKEYYHSYIFYEAIAGVVYRFLIDEHFGEYKTSLTNVFSDDDFARIRSSIEESGYEFIRQQLDENNNQPIIDINQLIKLIQTIQSFGILNVSKDYLDRFIIPFVKKRLDSSFLEEDRVRSFLLPRTKLDQENVLVNTIKFLTSGAFEHFILVLDQIDIALKNSSNAYKRKENFFYQLTSLIRQLNDSGFILILAVMDETMREVNAYIDKHEEARRIATDKHYLYLPEIDDVEEVEILLKEYLNRNPYRKEHIPELKAKTEEYGAPIELFPFDRTACLELLKKSNNTINDILSKAYKCLESSAIKLEENANTDTAKNFEFITAKTVQEVLSERKKR